MVGRVCHKKAFGNDLINIILLDGEIWICKPSGRNQGKGIFLVTSLQHLRNELSDRDDLKRSKPERIIQRSELCLSLKKNLYGFE